MPLNYQKLTDSFKRVALEKGFTFRSLGFCGENLEDELFSLIVNPSAKMFRCFVSGVHGNEPAGVLATLKFLNDFDSTRLRSDLGFIFIPLVNPYGCNHDVRFNFQGHDLNRHFFENKYPLGFQGTDSEYEGCICQNKFQPAEPTLVLDFLSQYSLELVHTLHEDSSENRFYAYAFGNSPQALTVYRKALRIAQTYCDLNMDSFIYDTPSTQGLVMNAYDGSLEARAHLDGVNYSICTETPMLLPLKKRIRINLELLMYFVNYF